MKYLIILLFWVLPCVGKTHCIETFPIKGNFSEVRITYDGSCVIDVIELCISSAGNGKNTLNLTRGNGNPTISIYHDSIEKIIYYTLSSTFEIKTARGTLSFRTDNIETRDKIRTYFSGIEIEFRLW